jgi:hypothetical protein
MRWKSGARDVGRGPGVDTQAAVKLLAEHHLAQQQLAPHSAVVGA